MGMGIVNGLENRALRAKVVALAQRYPRKDTEVKNPNEEVNQSSYPRLISDLTEEERKSVEECIRVLPKVFRECEGYLRGYEKNVATVFKLLQAMKVVGGAITYARSDLIAKHKIPKSLDSWLSPRL